MATNHLEELVAEWYEYQGYFVRRNVLVGRRDKGGWAGELDIVAFHPTLKHIVQVEPSMDAHSWEKREERYTKKFTLGKKHIPELFPGFDLPKEIEQIALFGLGKRATREKLAGGRVMMVPDLLKEIFSALSSTRIATNAVSENMPLLRTLQFVSDNWKVLDQSLGGNP